MKQALEDAVQGQGRGTALGFRAVHRQKTGPWRATSVVFVVSYFRGAISDARALKAT